PAPRICTRRCRSRPEIRSSEHARAARPPMKWSFQTKLIVAFLLFSLVPTLILTVVMFDATEQLKDKAGMVLYRNALSPARGLGNSALLDLKDLKPPVLDRRSLQTVNDLFDQVIEEVQIPSLRVLLVGPDLKVITGRSRRDDREQLGIGARIGEPYAS